MPGVWQVAEIQAAEKRLLSRVPPDSLMLKAAYALAVRASAMLATTYGAKVLLLVGPGNNGGDALYAGAELARRGAAVTAVLAVPDRAHPGGMAAFTAAGGRCVASSQVLAADLVIDGLLGIGATGPMRPELQQVARLSALGTVLAVDIASGVDADTGAVPGVAIHADVTLCMGALKVGVVAGEGRNYAGDVQVVDIGLDGDLPPARIRSLDKADVQRCLRRPGPADDKYTRGVVGIAAGSARYPGAAQLAVGAARLGGAGAVRYGGHAAAAVVERWPETIATETPGQAGRVQSWTIGSGMGEDAAAIEALGHVLAQQLPVLVDADGLTLLAHYPQLLADRVAAGGSDRAHTVLTPHAGEFARLFFDVGPDRIGSARRAAAESGAIVLLKGDATIVASPDGRCWINPTGTPALATAGSGDVLAGLTGSLLATGIDPLLAAAVGAYLHGLAGARAAQDGPVSAMDLLPALRTVIAEHLPEHAAR